MPYLNNRWHCQKSDENQNTNLHVLTNFSESSLKLEFCAMSRKFKVVALVSGGKDSCYSMLQCVAAGHEIVALANLRPKDESSRK